MNTYDNNNFDLDSILENLEEDTSGVSLEISDGVKHAEMDHHILEIGHYNGHQYWEPIPYQNQCTYSASLMPYNPPLQYQAPYPFYGGGMGEFVNFSVGRSDSLLSNQPIQEVSVHSTDYDMKKRKRRRTAFTISQRIALEKEFRKSKYIQVNRRFQLANEIQLSERVIKVWFQNERMRHKKEFAEAMNMSHGEAMR